MKPSSVLFLLAILCSMSACDFIMMQCIDGEGSNISKTLDNNDFSRIALSSFDADIQQGNTFSVEISGYENLFEHLDIEQKGDLLVLGTKDGICFKDDVLSAKIVLPTLEGLTINGSGDVITSDFDQNTDLELGINGSGSITTGKMSSLGKLQSYINGSGDIKTQGAAQSGSITITGSGTFDSFDMAVQTAEANIIGSGDIYLGAKESLNASITGSGDIIYAGSPKVRSNITGSGDIESRN
ncbi:MAG: head GIN domain-containing protein [Bacteroidota bacterium]